MNKKAMLGNVLIGVVMIALLIGLLAVAIPTIQDQMKSAQMNITNTPSSISGDLVVMLDYVPWVFAAFMVIFVIIFIMKMIRGEDGVDGDNSYDEDDEELEEEDEDDSDDDVVEEDEESEPEPAPKKQHSTRVITKKKDGRVRTNVTLNPTGYNVDKYELTKPTDTKLSLKEADFKKTKYD
jgi:hypothetical protein